MRPIFENKFNGKAFEVQIQTDHPIYGITVLDSVKRFLCYQYYTCIVTYCGDCIFKPFITEFRDENVFTNKELKEIFKLDEIYPDVDDFNLNNLFNN